MPVIVGKLASEVDALVGKEKRLLEQLNKYTIEIGVIAGESKERKLASFGLTNAELMFIHENGSPVNDIPARPVLQITINFVKTELIDKFLDHCFELINDGKWSDAALERELGRFCMRIQNFMRQGMLSNTLGLKENKPSTKKRKGSDVPLVDTSTLARSLVCRFVKA